MPHYSFDVILPVQVDKVLNLFIFSFYNKLNIYMQQLQCYFFGGVGDRFCSYSDKTCGSLSKCGSDVSVTPSVSKGSSVELIPSSFFRIWSKPPTFASDLIVTGSL